jgi:hypothetical protein
LAPTACAASRIADALDEARSPERLMIAEPALEKEVG